MVAAKDNLPRFTPEEYFAWEESQLCRHEYISGNVYAMSGGTINHSEIAAKINRLLGNHLEDSGCRVLNSDARVNVLETNDYTYPDISVTCDSRDRHATQYISYPCLIVEVLSDSTEAYDRGKKFLMYRKNPILQEYVLVSSTEIAIDIYRKTNDGRWEIIHYQAGDEIEFQSLGLKIPIDRVYRGITFGD
jgi:Uma2 family endonuclease